MKAATTALGLVAILLFFFPGLTSGQAGSQSCEADGEVKFLCGPVSPEDLAQLPETNWIVAAGMEDDGYLYLLNSDTLTSAAVYPAPQASHDWDQANYPDCPGPVASGFRPHGLHLIEGDEQRHRLLAVRHGARESIEVFDIDASETQPTLSWVGCVIAPDGVVFNSVAATSEGGMVATHFQLPSGAVFEWESASGWKELPGSETFGPNGIEISDRGDWLYIASWGTRSLIKLSRGQQEVSRETVTVSHHIDNVRWAEDGTLLAAGHVGPEFSSIGTCLSQLRCDGVRTQVTRIDVDSLSAQQIIDYPSNDKLILGTVAIEVADEIWVGGIAGGERIARFPKQ